MPKIPKRLAGPAPIDTTVETIYTVPASARAVIRHIHIQNPSASPIGVTVSIGADAAGVRILDAYSVPGAAVGVTGNVLDVWGPYTLEAGEIIQASATGGDDITTITIDGEVHTL